MEEQEPKSESILTGLLRASGSHPEHLQPDPNRISHLEALCSRGVDRVLKEVADRSAKLLDFWDPFSFHLEREGGS